MIGELTLGPLLYHWPGHKWRDFYFRIADEAPVDAVYLGEVVCPKRWPLQASYLPEVTERLERAGKTVVFTTPALVAEDADMALVREMSAEERLIEANDVAAFEILEGQPHVVGPYINIYNEATLARLHDHGALRAVLPVELPSASLAALAAGRGPELEVQVFGRWPLAISARCYHARAYGRTKATCQYACGDDPDGLDVRTLDGEAFLTINGVQTQSNAYACLIHEMPGLRRDGVSGFRLSPQAVDMVGVANAYRGILDGSLGPAAAVARIGDLAGATPLANGFYYERAGAEWIEAGS
ncbi:ubiquinone anaerobic biosynthesis protein UbiV [Ferruginivarius sediminum]|uniref:Ubiquinone biosynthesis protein UbiV n=1 Tax=Ferruginivarius sediminum TaxID=2661937 RepID=A0A369T4C1_9PROT|nr:U32 family peptidase [Ferruginivarius sediminum]RDD60191.1 U32 family peptidase [Ferruginivarius sediminum]